VSWLKKKTGPATVEITSASEFENFKSKGDVVVIGLFNTKEESGAFESIAQADDETPYGLVINNGAVATAAGVKAPAVVLYKNFDEGKNVYTGSLTDASALKVFVQSNSLPILIAFSQETAQKIFGGSIKNHILLFIDAKDAASADTVRAAAKPIATKYKGEYLFVTVDKSDTRIVEFFGIKDTEFPTTRAIQINEGVKKYKMIKQDLSSNGLNNFVEDFKNGKLPADLKSEEAPAAQEGDVKVLVGKTFKQEVHQIGKDVLVEFYAPWCGHCKKLAPIYDELATKFKSDKNIIIAKMDSTANEVEEVTISGFPTLKFFPADSAEILDFDGGRDLDSMVKFIEANRKSTPNLSTA
jgi:protein disulfide-isomerase A1